MPKTNLVIVESPAKAKTISGFLGSEFEVKSSYGHLRDLPSKGLGVDVQKDFAPTYEVDPQKAKVASELKKAAKGKEVWLATDEDREGEAIAWHLANVLGQDPSKLKRIVFHEITKPAIAAAVASPRKIDMSLVDSQQARRILDRLVGYELSPVLWKKIRTGLSAGRVQSVAVRLLVEREKEIRAHQTESSFKVAGNFTDGQSDFQAELNRSFESVDLSREFLDSIKNADFTVTDSTQRPGVRRPSAPFTTSTLQQEASRRLGYGVRQTMRLAQKLYEAGHITYMRTDSTVMSKLAIDAAGKLIGQKFGERYLDAKQYQTKSQTAQEAHEAIRPTDFAKDSAGDDSAQQKLYQLIWQRALSSQMAPAQIEFSQVEIAASTRSEKFIAKGQVLVFDGWLKVYPGAKDDSILPELSKGQSLSAKQITAEETFSRAAARYTEASLVRKLEQLGIGRPSTYAPTIGTIQDRGYVEKKDLEGEQRQALKLVLAGDNLTEDKVEITVGADRQKLIPTELAEVVTDFLLKYFAPVMSYDFTAHAETELDEVADGKMAWQKMLAEFYKSFHPLVEQSESASRLEASGARQLGVDPKSGQPITARLGRYGPVLQLGEGGKDIEEKPKFAPLPAGVRLEDITLEQALPMFELPRTVGQTSDGQEILSNIGRFGPYLKVGQRFISLKDHDPLTIDEQTARQMVEADAKIRAEREIAIFGGIKILNGPYGPYITDGKRNARIPKETDPKSLDQSVAEKMLADAPAKRYRKRTGKR